MPETSKAQAILHSKCPRCRKGGLFVSKAYDLKQFTKMHESCSSCGVVYAREPRFFEGAMYISYVMSVGLFLVSAFLIYNFVEQPSENHYVGAIILEVILLYPLMFRYARVLYLYAFGKLKYEGDSAVEGNN